MKNKINYKQKPENLSLIKEKKLNEINNRYNKYGEEYLMYLIRLVIKEKDKESLNFILNNFRLDIEEAIFVNCTCPEIFNILINYNVNNKYINECLLWKIVKIKRSYLFLEILLKNKHINNEVLANLFYYCCRNTHIKYIEALVKCNRFKELNIDINKAFYSQKNKHLTKYFLIFEEINKNVEVINYVIDNFNGKNLNLTEYCNGFIEEFYQKTPYKKYFKSLPIHENVNDIKDTILKIKKQIKIEEF